MSFDPGIGPPGRPRSTPIPDSDGGLHRPAPTPSQFLGQQPRLPWTPVPGRNIDTQFSVGPPNVNPLADPESGFAQSRRRSRLRTVVILFAVLIVVGAAGIAIYLSRARVDATPPPTTTVSDGDLRTLIVAGNEANWDATARLAAEAPAPLGIAGGVVTSVEVQRIGTGDDLTVAPG